MAGVIYTRDLKPHNLPHSRGGGQVLLLSESTTTGSPPQCACLLFTWRPCGHSTARWAMRRCIDHGPSQSKSGNTPPDAGLVFGNNFRSALFTWAKTRRCLQTNHTKPPPAGFGGAVRRSRAITKNMPFCAFFYVQPKYQNNAIFVNTEGFRPCLSKPSYRAPKWALMVRLMQKERPKSPQKSLF